MRTTDTAVTIEIGHQIARVTPGEPMGVVEHLLSYASNEFEFGGQLGHVLHKRRRRLCKPAEGGGNLIPSGLVTPVAEGLSRAGYRVSVEDRREFSQPQRPDAACLRSTQPDMARRFQALADCPRGLIACCGRASIVAWTALVCRLFPKARLLVAWNADRKKLRRMQHDLSFATGRSFDLAGSYPWPPDGGRLLCSLTDLYVVLANDFDLVVFLDALQLLSPAHDQAFYALRWQHVYGLIDNSTKLCSRALLQLQARFGPIINPTTGAGSTGAPVCVRWVVPPAAAPVRGIGGALERKRAAFWHNNDRNDLLAGVAAAFAAGDIDTLWRAGLLLEEGGDKQPVGGLPAVSIVVESPEHGRELLRRLAGWRLISCLPSPAGTPTVNPFAVRLLDKTVVTIAAASTFEEFDVDVLLWAGSEHAPSIQSFPPRSRHAAGGATWVDVADDFDAHAKGSVQRRAQSYLERGWQSIGGPSWVGAETARG